jgi:hypothetical protein
VTADLPRHPTCPDAHIAKGLTQGPTAHQQAHVPRTQRPPSAKIEPDSPQPPPVHTLGTHQAATAWWARPRCPRTPHGSATHGQPPRPRAGHGEADGSPQCSPSSAPPGRPRACGHLCKQQAHRGWGGGRVGVHRRRVRAKAEGRWSAARAPQGRGGSPASLTGDSVDVRPSDCVRMSVCMCVCVYVCV